MGEQGGLRTGWLAAFGTEGYEGEPPLLEELGVNFGHIQSKVCFASLCFQASQDSSSVGYRRQPLTEHTDISSTQPACPHRPTHYGRLRPGWPHPLLPPLWHLPPL